jgi:holo-[acyl-carrier protein] synthase
VIVGLGVDVVDVARFAESLARTPGMRDRLFTPGELGPEHNPRSDQSLAARFAAKEAIAKALEAPAGLSWQDAEVVTAESGKPELVITGTVRTAAQALGVKSVHLSLAHDGGIATAYVILEG